MKDLYKEGKSKMGNKYSYYNLVEKGVIELEGEDEEEKKMFEEL